MFLRINFISVVKAILFSLFLVISINGSIVLKKTESSKALIHYTITKGTKTNCFAITISPTVKTTSHILLKKNNGSISPITATSSGWLGNRYVQWFSFNTDLNNKDTAEISLSFNQPILRKSDAPQNTGPIIDLPLIIKPKPIIKRNIIPTHNFSTGLRIDINEDGLYKLTGKEIKELGVPIDNINVKNYKLYCKNIEIPIFIAGSDDGKIDEDDQLYFYGKFLRGETSYYTSYSYSNVYWLCWEGTRPGLRFAEVSGGSEKDPDDYANKTLNQALPFKDTIHVEKDNDIRWLGDLFNVSETSSSPFSDDTIDNWYWGFAGDKELTHFTFNLPSPNSKGNNYCKLRIALGGLSNLNDLDPDHNFSIHLNDDPTGIEAIWDGQNEIIVESNTIPVAQIRNGENKITLIKNHPDSIPDRIAVNWFEFTYDRNFIAQNNTLKFKTTKDAFNKLTAYSISNFSSKDINLWDISNFRKFQNVNISEISKNYSISFYDSLGSSGTFIALTSGKYQSPAKIKLDTINPTLFSISPDYIIISTDSLITIMEPLKQYYTDQGLSVSTLNIQDIYNVFSYGIHNPESIRKAIQYIYGRNINNPPKYLLFGGDASHDMYKQKEYMNIIPTHLSRTPNWGPSADDGYFAKVNGDDNFADLLVGRLPAENPADMQILIDKTINYLKYPEMNQWRDNLLLAGGFEKDFTSFNNEAVTSLIGDGFNILRMDADPKSSYYVGGSSASDMMAGFINSGVYCINFIGHGGGNVWSDSKFFSYSDLEKLHNSRWSKGGRLPIIFSFTCLTGFFESVFYKSLGEEFLRNSRDGAICFYGAAGYTRRNIDISLSRTMLQNGLSGNFNTLGELINTTEIMMLAQNESEALPLINQYNLLGDPALPWSPAPELSSVTLDKKQHSKNDTLKINGTTNFTGSGHVSIKVMADNSIWDEKLTTISNGSFTSEISLKTNSSTASGTIRTFAWNDTSVERGTVTFSKDAFALYDLKTDPNIPIAGKQIELECRIDLPDSTEVPIVQCLYTIGDPAEEFYNFSDSSYTFLYKDSLSGLWKSTTPIIVPENDLGNFSSPHLILQFKSTGLLGISQYYSFKIQGITDLEILSSNSYISMINDSLKLCFAILNSGSEKAYSPSILFITDSNDTLYNSIISDTIQIGETYNCTTSIIDLNGEYNITGSVNFANTIKESDFSNNTITFPFSLSVRDMLVPTDTLKSIGNGLLVNPYKNLSYQRRVFVFYKPLEESSPLQTSSKFNSSGNDSLMSFKVISRPALADTDSLKLTFFSSKDTLADSITNASIFAYNEDDSLWTFEGNDRDSSTEEVTIVTQSRSFLAPAIYLDKTGPQIRAYVNGKEVLYVDYIAKGMPFNIIFSDTSGIDPTSISIKLNGEDLSNEQYSASSKNSSSTSLTITAYPPEINSVDTLSIYAKDLAGNESEKDFIYRPGQKLDIKFFSCHPNPFAARKGDVIRFAYLLTDAASSVEMTIYTIAGRPVWRWKNDRQLTGYQEISWDGTTMNDRINGKGFRLANGTYYAKLVVKNSKRKVEKIIRIAKLEGY